MTNFNDFIKILDNGTFELGSLLKDEVTGVDFSRIAVKDGKPLDLDIVSQAIANLSRYGNTPGYHGIIVVVADVTDNGYTLPLTRPADSKGVLYHPNCLPPYFAIDAEDLTSFLYGIATGPQHDGAVLIDSRTSQVLAYNLILDLLPLKSIIQTGNNGNGYKHDGLRRDAACNFSKMKNVLKVYTASEMGYMREYERGQPIQNIPIMPAGISQHQTLQS